MAEFEAQFSALKSWLDKIGIHGEDQNRNSWLWLIMMYLNHKVSFIIFYDQFSFSKKLTFTLPEIFFFLRHDPKEKIRTGPAPAVLFSKVILSAEFTGRAQVKERPPRPINCGCQYHPTITMFFKHQLFNVYLQNCCFGTS